VTEDRFGKLLGAYVLEGLTADEERDLEHHLEECPRCREELERIRQTHTLLRELAASEPPPALKAQMMAHVTRETTAPAGPRWKLWVPAAAALLVAAILGIGLLRDEYYEMWYAKESGERISCGTFRAQPGSTTTVDLTAPVNAVSYPKIEVTREPDDGNPAASGQEVLVGDLRDL
jgi:predicted anti-sigma-YlaC factor YlaD